MERTNDEVVLAIEKIVKRYGEMRAVDTVSFEVRAGEILGLIGANGAGKSTVISIVAGANVPDEGAVTVAGRRLTHHTPAESLNAGVAVIYQEPRLIDHQSIAENMFLGRRKPGIGPLINWRETVRRAREILLDLGIDVDVTKPISEASLWEKWTASLGRVLVANPRILILDEPTASLDHDGVEKLFHAVREMQKRGTAIIFVSHRLPEVLELCSRVHVMRDGRSVFDGPTGDLTRDDLVQHISGAPADAATEISLTEQIGVFAGTTSAGSGEFGEVKLRVDNLRLAHRQKPVSFEVRAGEIVGLAGLVGSGRTSLLRAIAGADKRARGQVSVDGARMTLGSTMGARRRGIAFLPEDRIHQGIIDNLPIAAHITIGRRTIDLKLPWWIRFPEEGMTAQKWIRSLSIRGAAPQNFMRTLSGGNQQKVLFARLIEHHPSVMLLDEPSRGVDVGSRREIYEVIRKLAARGMAVLVAISDLDELAELADRVVVLKEGEAVAELTEASLTRTHIIQAIF